ncbi:DUF3558 domain-containing protein [Corynebacterium uterequi]|uniref:hypothetical protein n=1 Tax=Corynebacterium uterequi TaxID=1072256 RepID=UPI0011873831|nr:hypothetical protein [Corynebacterium uterequi]
MTLPPTHLLTGRARRRRRIVAALTLLALLPVVGCQDASYSKVTNTELPPGIYLNGDFVELTIRDPNGPEQEWIDPCNEIPEEVLEELGLKRGKRSGGKWFGMDGCTGNPSVKISGKTSLETEQIMLSLTAGPTPYHQFLNDPNRVESQSLKDLPDALFRKFDQQCDIVVDTRRGIFIVGAGSLVRGATDEGYCQMATRAFYKIYNSLREKK